MSLDSLINTYMFRLDVANHVVGTVQGITQGILVCSVMQTFNHTCGEHTEDHNPELKEAPVAASVCF